VLPLGEFSGNTPEPLLIYSESYAVTVFVYDKQSNTVITNKITKLETIQTEANKTSILPCSSQWGDVHNKSGNIFQ